ncbi:tungsten-containing aldehyde ferredoxin oxidoreductase related protein [Thermoplasma acidophilum]|uniref:Tungsten-containing aldehyde ferredoxin oxidoreductase related protein n=1 Tax=Thermoplasma acidophilum (strain ATCC 25905 / DSM 1728 / JCM 9062 / NBRC 15155 / AMRC-C165) TaxID=273075 RepID=Q9HJX8_THEAC|nr:tungsten-containing aldehyde ferredoxin oxidoreductase related protein [Thermoplasma acidophilum]
MIDLGGFWNKLIFVDLSGRDVWFDGLSEDLWEKYMGGVGLGSYLFTKYGGNFDPFSEKNPIIIMTGPLVGTAFPNSGRHEVVSRSPLTTFLGESNSGGRFGFELKRSGSDGMVITGKSDVPVSIFIDDGDVRLAETPDLWGLDIYETQAKMKKEKNYSVMCIGPAGENRVLFSSIMNDEGRAAGRTGLGAVMGSKKLKAIAVYGRKIVEVNNRAEYNRIVKEASKSIIESPVVSGFRSYGSMIWMDGGIGFNDIPANYFMDRNFQFDDLSSIKFHEEYSVSSYNCAACVIGCGRTVRYNGLTVDGPEYETVAALGPLLGNTSFQKIIEWNHEINRLGMDTISTGVIVSAIRHFIKAGLVNDGSVESYYSGSFEKIGQMIQDIAMRRGSGDRIADGLYRFASSLGIDRDLIATVKGLEIPLHDPRAFKAQGIVYATSTRGADHMQGDMYQIDIGGDHPDLGIVSGDRFSVDSDDRVRTVIRTQDFRQVYNSLIICYYAQPDPETIAKAYALATGFDSSIKDLVDRGSEIINLKRRINEGLGMRPEDDWLPAIVRMPIEGESPESGTSDEELISAIQRYYRLRGWGRYRPPVR